MGRSVAYLSNSLHEVYVDVSEFDNDGMDWDDWVENISAELRHKFPSLRKTEEWDGRETRIFLDNLHCEIGVSEYSGLASISIRARQDIDSNRVPIAENWIDLVWNNIEKVVQDFSGEVYVKQGSFSNGEGVFNVKGKKEGFCHNGMGKTYEF
jgi:hypothetical protein